MFKYRADLVGSSGTYLPWLRMTLQLGQQSWLTRPRLGNRPTPTACRPLWSLSVTPLHLIYRERHEGEERMEGTRDNERDKVQCVFLTLSFLVHFINI